MSTEKTSCYTGKVLRVDLTRETLTEELLDEATLRKWVGGVGLGARYLYEEVPPGVEWSDEENRLIIASGPVGGTRIGGSGTISVVTKGCLTNGATSTQANGFMGAYMKFAGYDAVIVQGAGRQWRYLYLHDGKAELRDATALIGKDFWETEDLIRKELQQSQRGVSIFGIGPAGENLVKFAAIVGDRGHVAGHNGVGAVLGSKKLKAIVAARGQGSVAVADVERVASLARELWDNVQKARIYNNSIYQWGTIGTADLAESRVISGRLPVRNLTTNIFPQARLFSSEYLRGRHEIKRTPCWACQMHHCHQITIKDGPYAGQTFEEPEYEAAASWGPLIGNTSPEAAVMLSDLTDRLGLEVNEAGWLVGMVMELYETGTLTLEDTDGLEMKWGNVEACRTLLHRIARREGFGDVLAEGVMRAAQQLGSEALNCGVFVQKGISPQTHDHRASWGLMFGTATASNGLAEGGGVSRLQDVGMEPPKGPFDPMHVSTLTAKSRGIQHFNDCLGVCFFCLQAPLARVVEALNTVTGWSLSDQEAQEVGFRVSNLLRAFNVRHGITPEVEFPSSRYRSAPVDGPAKGTTIAPVWGQMLDNLYQLMGWDRATGRPLPETLRRLGLEHVSRDLWS